jgi:uncharacterized ubiquitin-like protein YukD
MYCLSLDLRVRITPLVSSNFSLYVFPDGRPYLITSISVDLQLTDYPIDILDLRLTDYPIGILDLRLTDYPIGILDLRLTDYPIGILDLQSKP